MTQRNAGPSFRRVVMSLKRIPSVGKSLMSRIFARSSATSIARLYYSLHAAARKTQGGVKVSAEAGTVTRSGVIRHATDARLTRSLLLNSPISRQRRRKEFGVASNL